MTVAKMFDSTAADNIPAVAGDSEVSFNFGVNFSSNLVFPFTEGS